MQPVFTAEEMRRVDRRAIEELGIPGAVLMENAGRGAAEAVLAFLGTLGRPRRGARVAIVCGKGGNGGDGFVAARYLAAHGVRPRVLLVARPEELTGDPALKLAEMGAAGLHATVVEGEPDLAAEDVVVDALLGTGTRGVPAGMVAQAIAAINGSGRPVVALDIPSGLPADGGAPPGAAVRASLTVTFAGLKRGLVTPPGSDFAGTVRVAAIGVARAHLERGIRTFLLEPLDIRPLFPARPRDAHKGSYGALLIVAGSPGKTGAAALAARAAMRSGAGLVTVATPTSQQPIVAGLVLESMTEPVPETLSHTISLDAIPVITRLADSRDAVAVGPGLGLAMETREAVCALVRHLPRPVVVDADALTALGDHLDLLRDAAAPRCLTPHPGEMARLLGGTIADVQRDRIECVRNFATRHGVHVVLKGAASAIASPDGDVCLCPTGNPGMASGGMGDVLTGMVGAFLGRGLAPQHALRAAVYLHGLAGDVGAERVGEEALIASDLLDAMPEAFRRVVEDRPGLAGVLPTPAGGDRWPFRGHRW